jgi:hypothetical protein
VQQPATSTPPGSRRQRAEGAKNLAANAWSSPRCKASQDRALHVRVHAVALPKDPVAPFAPNPQRDGHLQSVGDLPSTGLRTYRVWEIGGERTYPQGIRARSKSRPL